jgi:hypothetical protein
MEKLNTCVFGLNVCIAAYSYADILFYDGVQPDMIAVLVASVLAAALIAAEGKE